MEQLNVYLERVIEVNRPDEAGEKIRGELHLAVNNALQRLQNNLVVQTRVVPFGSFVSGFYNNNSDLDLALKGFVHVAFLKKSSLKQIAPNLAPGQEWVGLSFLDQGTRAQLLRQAANLLVSHGITKRDKLQYILHARVPLIKFRDAQYGIDCDLSIGGDGTEYKAQFFKHVGEVNDGFAPLYCIIKLWMKAHLMNDGSTGTFNSHCLALLTVFYLQTCKPPLLPPLYKLLFHDRPDPGQLRLLAEGAQYNRDQAMDISKRRSSAARHQFNSQFNTLALDLAGFVNFMGDVLKEALSGANSTVRLSTWYAEQQLVPPPAGLKAYYLTVEEPFDASDNCARTFGSKRDVSWSLIYAADVFERTGQVLASAAAETVPTKAVLAYLLGPDALIGSPTCNALVPQVWTEAEQAAVLGLIQSGDSAFNAAGGKRLPGGGRSSPAAARGTAMRNMFLEALADSASEDLVDFLLPAHGVEGPQKFKDWFLDAASQQRKQEAQQERAAANARRKEERRQSKAHAKSGPAGSVGAGGGGSSTGGPVHGTAAHMPHAVPSTSNAAAAAALQAPSSSAEDASSDECAADSGAQDSDGSAGTGGMAARASSGDGGVGGVKRPSTAATASSLGSTHAAMVGAAMAAEQDRIFAIKEAARKAERLQRRERDELKQLEQSVGKKVLILLQLRDQLTLAQQHKEQLEQADKRLDVQYWGAVNDIPIGMDKDDMSGQTLDLDVICARRQKVALELQSARTNIHQIQEQQQHAQAQIKKQQQLLQQRTQQMQQQQQQRRPQPQPAPKYVPVTTGKSSMHAPPPPSDPGSENRPPSSGAHFVHAPVTRPVSSANAPLAGAPVTRPVSSAAVSVDSDPITRPMPSGAPAGGAAAPATHTGPASAVLPWTPQSLPQQQQQQQQQQQSSGRSSWAPVFAGAQAPHAPPPTTHTPPQRVREHLPLDHGLAAGAALAPPQTQAAAHAAPHAIPPRAPPSPVAAAPSTPPSRHQKRYMPPLGPAPKIIPTAATGAAGAPPTVGPQTQAAQASPSHQTHVPFVGLAMMALPPPPPPPQQPQQQQQHFGTSRTLLDGREGGPSSGLGALGLNKHGRGPSGGVGAPANTVQQLQKYLEQAESERQYQPQVLQHQHQRQQQPEPMAVAAQAAASSAVSRPSRKERRQQLQQQQQQQAQQQQHAQLQQYVQQQQQPQHPSPPGFPVPFGPRSGGSSDTGCNAGAATSHATHTQPATAKPPKKARPPKNKSKPCDVA